MVVAHDSECFVNPHVCATVRGVSDSGLKPFPSELCKPVLLTSIFWAAEYQAYGGQILIPWWEILFSFVQKSVELFWCIWESKLIPGYTVHRYVFCYNSYVVIDEPFTNKVFKASVQ